MSQIDLDSLLSESLLQVAARKIPRNVAEAQKAKYTTEALETSVMLRQWEAKREWTHTSNILVFTRQQCECCREMSHTFDGRFLGYSNNRVKGATKMEQVKTFELDKPKLVQYRDSFVPLCHHCADIQEDWPLEGD